MTAEILMPDDPAVLREGSRAVYMDRLGTPLYAHRSSAGLRGVLKKALPDGEAPSSTGADPGERDAPVNFALLREMRNDNVHHSACLDAKNDCVVGLGFAKSKPKSADEEEAKHPLDDRSPESFLSGVLRPATAEYLNFGFGYIEAVTGENGAIEALHHLDAARVGVTVEDTVGNFHYRVEGEGGSGGTVRLCRFGDRERFSSRYPGLSRNGGRPVSEVIRIRSLPEMSRWYGMPTWLSAVPAIEIVQLLSQWKADFFLNRGVPEFMLFITGATLSKSDWDSVLNTIKGHVGSGNSHKTLALNIGSKDVKIQLERLAMEGAKDAEEFQTVKDTLALDIVSAHRVPPLLAGIQIPGKLGASNEMTNALLGFQLLYCASAQRHITETLNQTLAAREPDLKGWFRLRTIKDEMFAALAEPGAVALSTVGGMRQGLPNAQAEGRDLGSGLRKGDADLLRAVLSRAAR